jgi:hypothetical protein
MALVRERIACRQSYCQLLRIEGVSSADPHGRILLFLDRNNNIKDIKITIKLSIIHF